MPVHSLYSAFSLALTLSVLLATTPAYAQDAEATAVALGDSERRRTSRLDMHRLSVAIERMEQGPFRIPAEGSVLFFPQTQLGFSSSLATLVASSARSRSATRQGVPGFAGIHRRVGPAWRVFASRRGIRRVR